MFWCTTMSRISPLLSACSVASSCSSLRRRIMWPLLHSRGQAYFLTTNIYSRTMNTASGIVFNLVLTDVRIWWRVHSPSFQRQSSILFISENGFTILKINVFRKATPCSLVEFYRLFGWTYWFQPQCWRAKSSWHLQNQFLYYPVLKIIISLSDVWCGFAIKISICISHFPHTFHAPFISNLVI
jgi:hypothetical protein